MPILFFFASVASNVWWNTQCLLFKDRNPTLFGDGEREGVSGFLRWFVHIFLPYWRRVGMENFSRFWGTWKIMTTVRGPNLHGALQLKMYSPNQCSTAEHCFECAGSCHEFRCILRFFLCFCVLLLLLLTLLIGHDFRSSRVWGVRLAVVGYFKFGGSSEKAAVRPWSRSHYSKNVRIAIRQLIVCNRVKKSYQYTWGLTCLIKTVCLVFTCCPAEALFACTLLHRQVTTMKTFGICSQGTGMMHLRA